MEQAQMIIPARDTNSIARDWLKVTPHFTERQIDGLKLFLACDENTLVKMVQTCARNTDMSEVVDVFKANYPGAMGVLVLPDVRISIVNGRRRELPAQTFRNFMYAFSHDEDFFGCKYNLLRNCCEIHTVKDGILNIKDRDGVWDARTKMYLEENYGLRSKDTFDGAAMMLFHENEYNPTTELIKSLPTWDGDLRREHFLSKFAKADDTPYTREVSRLIFDGIIARAFNPGCKFDIMPVLIGKQGCGKSTLIRWLALNDTYYGEVNTFDGKESIEQLFGKTVIEVSELKAFKSAKDTETIKAYLTRQADRYREPYERSPKDYPRRCVFIGSTNLDEFLTDRTGNRRFYPVKVNCSGSYIFQHEQEIREYIAQCFAEAYYLSTDKATRPSLTIAAELIPIATQMQTQAQEDDWRIGQIEYRIAHDLDIGEIVCAKICWTDYLSLPIEQFKKAQQQEIGQILRGFPFLKKLDTQKPFPGITAKQTAYQKIAQPQGYEDS